MARTDASATPDTGLLKLAFRKADVSRLSVVGTDLVLVMKDGSQHVLQDMGLQAMTRPDLRVQFADGSADVSDLLSILDHARLRHVRLAQQAVVGLARQSHRRVFVKLMCELGGREGFAVVGPEDITAEDQAALFALGGAGVVMPMELAASA